MARPATGQIIEPKNGRAWALRFRVPYLKNPRQYLTLGTARRDGTVPALNASSGTSWPTSTAASGNHRARTPSPRHRGRFRPSTSSPRNG